MKMLLRVLALLLGATTVVTVGAARGPEAGISVAPAVVAVPSGGGHFRIQVTNLGRDATVVRPSLYAMQIGGGKARLSAPPGEFAGLVAIAPDLATVSPRGSAAFSVRIKPAPPPAADQYLLVAFTGAPTMPGAAGSAVAAGVGTVLAFRGLHAPAARMRVSVMAPWLTLGHTVRVRATVANTGRGWFVPTVAATLAGERVRRTLLPLLPGASAGADMRFGGVAAGLRILRIRADAGGREVTVIRKVLVLPTGALIGGAVGFLVASILMRMRRRNKMARGL
jgi:hypothetical protein